MRSEKPVTALFFLSACLSVIAVLTICLSLLVQGIPAIREIGPVSFLLGQSWKPVDTPASYGILPMMAGSLYVTALALLMGVPIGIFCAVFLVKFCPRRLYGFCHSSVSLLAGIPSIIYGFFGMQVIVPFVRDTFGGNGYSILSAGIVLAIMILPTVISISESALLAVPKSYDEGSLSLGATKEITVFHVMLPAAKSGIFTSVILGLGRAIGETMAVVMVAGGAVMPLQKMSLLKPVRTLTANIVMEMSYSSGLHTRALIATGVVLFVFIVALNISIHLIRHKGGKAS